MFCALWPWQGGFSARLKAEGGGCVELEDVRSKVYAIARLVIYLSGKSRNYTKPTGEKIFLPQYVSCYLPP